MIEPFIYPAATLIAGVDEVGRGPLVGAVVTAAVISIRRSRSSGWRTPRNSVKTPPGAV